MICTCAEFRHFQRGGFAPWAPGRMTGTRSRLTLYQVTCVAQKNYKCTDKHENMIKRVCNSIIISTEAS